MLKKITPTLVIITFLSLQMSDMYVYAQEKKHSKDDSFISLQKPIIAQKYIPEAVALEDRLTHLVDLSLDSGQPQVVYNAQGQKVSEYYFNDDNSEHRIFYEDNGDVITVIFDPHKIKQQEITLKPDGSSVTKFYDEQGKLEEIKTKLVDGAIFSKKVFEGDMVSAQVLNKSGQLEGQTDRDDYGNITTTQQNSDGVATSLIRYRQDVVINDDGTRSTTTYDPSGKIIIIVTDSEEKMISKAVYDADGKKVFELISMYDGGRKEITYFYDGQQSQEIYDFNNNILLSDKYFPSGQIKLRIIYNLGQGKEVIKFDPQGKITSKKIYNIDDTLIVSEGYYSSGKIKSKSMYRQDRNQEKLNYDSKGKLISKEVYNLNGILLSSDQYYAHGKLKTQEIYLIDGSKDILHYNHKGTMTLKESYDAVGNKISLDW